MQERKQKPVPNKTLNSFVQQNELTKCDFSFPENSFNELGQCCSERYVRYLSYCIIECKCIEMFIRCSFHCFDLNNGNE